MHLYTIELSIYNTGIKIPLQLHGFFPLSEAGDWIIPDGSGEVYLGETTGAWKLSNGHITLLEFAEPNPIGGIFLGDAWPSLGIAVLENYRKIPLRLGQKGKGLLTPEAANPKHGTATLAGVTWKVIKRAF